MHDAAAVPLTRDTAAGAAALLLCAACASAPAGGPPQPEVGPAPVAATTVARAQAGDTIYLVEHRVRPERRQQFEAFVHEVLWPAMQSPAPAGSASSFDPRQVRLLVPAAPEEDGSFAYTFVIDPAAAGESYNVLELLRARLGEDEALRQYGMFTETWAGDFTTRLFIQSR